MKKVISLILVAMMALSLFAGCADTADDGVTKVAIVQQLDHSSLDEIRTAIEAELSAASIEFEVFNGQNDATVLNQIGAQIMGDNFDAIIPIATLAAQCMVTAAEGTDMPIIYAACSDPESAGLTGMDTVTGTSDALNTRFIINMMLEVNPDIARVGLLYSNSEVNSATPIAEAKAYLDEKGISYIEKTGNTTDEIVAATSALVGQCDAVFTPTDNVVMAAEGAVAEILNEAGIPHYAGADSFVTSGAFATCGVNYTELGAYTGKMAIDILNGGEVPEFHIMDGGIISINSETATKLGLDTTVFETMANTVVDMAG
ncbi:MAG: ABC transporter substrate-binding protein [Oscillospiraceae bacterium]|nr:ABC transporter substrate-binding protein [Oscillospiraceae bacterium]